MGSEFPRRADEQRALFLMGQYRATLASKEAVSVQLVPASLQT